MLATVILAAGASRRMGAPKLLLPWGSTTVLGQVVATALEGTPGRVVVVLGAHSAALPAHPRLRVVWNRDWEAGMLSSAQAGVRALPDGWSSVLIVPGDLPRVQPETYRRLMSGPSGSICIPTYGGRRGHPVRVPVGLADELLALDPAVHSLRSLLAPARVTHVEVDDPGIHMDLDTPEDYNKNQTTIERPASVVSVHHSPRAVAGEHPAAPNAQRRPEPIGQAAGGTNSARL